jgi:hypothetical protein
MTIKDLQEKKRICEDIIRALDKPRRLIDAEHLKKRATDWWGDCWDNYAQSTEDFLEYIDNEPTVDAVPVVRCKECKYFHYNKAYNIQGFPIMSNSVCDKWANGCRTDENGYCFLGERREDA